MKPNPGHLPPEAYGKNVRVRLFADPPGREAHVWPASGKGGCCWELRNYPFDIREYEVVG